MAEMAREYISNARQLSSNGCYSQSLDLYYMAFERNPLLKTTYEPEFRAVMIKLNELLVALNKIDDIFSNFTRAINTFPRNIYLLNEVGKYLYKFGFYEEAWSQFQKALVIDAGYVTAEKNLNSLKNLMVERWHFRMLNDKIRNDSYRAAIHQKVKPKQTSVLDIGTGTGILSMYATECDPIAVAACDGSDAMIALADCILEENRLLMAIMLLNRVSTTLCHSEIEGKKSLLITELFDAGLFGEHVLHALFHAKQYLLTEDAEVLPGRAEFFIMGVNSDLLNSKYQLNKKIKSILGIPSFNIHVSTEEAYDCDDIHLYKDVKYMTAPASIVKVDFNSLDDVYDKLCNTETFTIDFTTTQQGEINSFIGWFNLYLTENITITTDPRDKNRANAWQQAVFFDTIPITYEENEIFKNNFAIHSEKILMIDKPEPDMRISQVMLRFLNDITYMEIIKKCIGMASVYLGQIADISNITIVDLCPFPIFGILMLQRGIHSLTCCAKTEADCLFIKEVLRINHISNDNITYLMDNTWTYKNFKDDKYHAIFCHFLDLNGDLNLHGKDIAHHLKNHNLVPGGLFMPATVTLMGEVVSSHWLDFTNRVHDSNVGYKMSLHVNKYQVSQVFDLDYTHLDYISLTDPINLGDCTQLTSDVVNILINKDGDANAIICWYSIELMENLSEITTKRPKSFIDGIGFLANPIIPMSSGNIANILRCVDSDGCFKLIVDLENM